MVTKKSSSSAKKPEPPEQDETKIIRQWTDDHFEELVSSRTEYHWGDKSSFECVKERNSVSREIVNSRIRNHGAVDLKTLDKVMAWGGFGSFPLREEEKLMEITGKTFGYLDAGEVEKAVLELLSIHGVGIASATKIIGLYDQYRYAIYDSRVGTALRSLRLKGKRMVKCPSGRSRSGDSCTDKNWAENYVELLRILDMISERLNERGYPFNIADVEMALFMMGK